VHYGPTIGNPYLHVSARTPGTSPGPAGNAVTGIFVRGDAGSVRMKHPVIFRQKIPFVSLRTGHHFHNPRMIL
jgi:hypothetical protein